jgi:hypothetical protein
LSAQRITVEQVRCDAASLGIPCTNCTAFSIECRIPAPKRKKTTTASRAKDGDRYGLSELYMEWN